MQHERVKALGGGAGGITLPSPSTPSAAEAGGKKWGVALEAAPATPMAEAEADDEVEENEENEGVNREGANQRTRKTKAKAKRKGKRSMASRSANGSPSAALAGEQKRRPSRASRSRAATVR